MKREHAIEELRERKREREREREREGGGGGGNVGGRKGKGGVDRGASFSATMHTE